MPRITVVNQTEEIVRIAIFKKPALRPTLGAVAWQVVTPPPGGGLQVVQVPSDHSVFAEYSTHPGDPSSLDQRTNTISFVETTACFEIHDVPADDQSSSRAEIRQSFDDLVMNEVRIYNKFGAGVLAHLQLDGADVYAPQVISPGGLLIEDIRSGLYLAVVGQFTYRGQALVQEEISLTETPILEGQTATVTGSIWKGYAISLR